MTMCVWQKKIRSSYVIHFCFLDFNIYSLEIYEHTFGSQAEVCVWKNPRFYSCNRLLKPLLSTHKENKNYLKKREGKNIKKYLQRKETFFFLGISHDFISNLAGFRLLHNQWIILVGLPVRHFVRWLFVYKSTGCKYFGPNRFISLRKNIHVDTNVTPFVLTYLQCAKINTTFQPSISADIFFRFL